MAFRMVGSMEQRYLLQATSTTSNPHNHPGFQCKADRWAMERRHIRGAEQLFTLDRRRLRTVAQLPVRQRHARRLRARNEHPFLIPGSHFLKGSDRGTAGELQRRRRGALLPVAAPWTVVAGVEARVDPAGRQAPHHQGGRLKLPRRCRGKRGALACATVRPAKRRHTLTHTRPVTP